MKAFLICIFVCGALGAPFNDERILGGEDAKLGDIPYIANMKYKNNHICGGSIISDIHILTAAHCVYRRKAELYTVQVGVIDEYSPSKEYSVDYIIIHENFTDGGIYPNDIAILVLTESITFGPNIRIAQLPSYPPYISGDSITSTLAGWGADENGDYPRYLKKVDFPLYNDDICLRYLYDYESRYHICAGALDGSRKQCSGDSGGPLFANKLQHGIVSWSNKPCSLNQPGVFTRVSNYREWIARNAGV